jgi:hypothetical protein
MGHGLPPKNVSSSGHTEAKYTEWVGFIAMFIAN